MISVGVLGARGRMGRTVCAAVVSDPRCELVAAVDTETGALVSGVEVSGSPDALLAAAAEVAVDFTHPSAVMGNIRWCLTQGIHMVVGTTGLSSGDLDEAASLAAAGGANIVVAPNFAIGAVLALRFAEQAAAWFPDAEVIELHHDGKADAPSGTALTTARRIAAARATAPTTVGGDAAHPGARGADVDGVRVHSVRLPGLVAHEEILFGGPGQILTIRHDSTERSSFMPGVLLAVKAVAGRPGLTLGLDALLED
ncbi:MAG: 4-hydroxy-tetrahydrodipicolinate reductase [Actinomycetota bacterium]